VRKKVFKIIFVIMVLCIVGIANISSATIITIDIEVLANSVSEYKLLQSKVHIVGIYTYDMLTPETPISFIGTYSYYNVQCGAALNIDESVFFDDINNTDFVQLSSGVEVDDIIWQPDNYDNAALSGTTLPTTIPVLSDWDCNDLIIEEGNAPLFFEYILD